MKDQIQQNTTRWNNAPVVGWDVFHSHRPSVRPLPSLAPMTKWLFSYQEEEEEELPGLVFPFFFFSFLLIHRGMAWWYVHLYARAWSKMAYTHHCNCVCVIQAQKKLGSSARPDGPMKAHTPPPPLLFWWIEQLLNMHTHEQRSIQLLGALYCCNHLLPSSSMRHWGWMAWHNDATFKLPLSTPLLLSSSSSL